MNVLAAVPSFDANADHYVNIPEDTPVGKSLKFLCKMRFHLSPISSKVSSEVAKKMNCYSL